MHILDPDRALPADTCLLYIFIHYSAHKCYKCFLKEERKVATYIATIIQHTAYIYPHQGADTGLGLRLDFSLYLPKSFCILDFSSLRREFVEVFASLLSILL